MEWWLLPIAVIGLLLWVIPFSIIEKAFKGVSAKEEQTVNLIDVTQQFKSDDDCLA